MTHVHAEVARNIKSAVVKTNKAKKHWIITIKCTPIVRYKSNIWGAFSFNS